ncbi:unnamed protein product [Rotaria sp. Silwood2]|nr:unnamed protein product [Rotaria sp. Silwood2]CAF2494143.1 unnamed protein product [Rotaria sp. Silwood2]CAF2748865.1 unnamed protein product [Rotaria sp. Silwood2]CAF2894002.1 unnamed protein product [Rotaria sp. Silwood2]CAF3888656.1 unnamed protein product [Rotaria sp. Silwood2]
MSGAINQFGLHTVEYTLRKKRLEDPLYIAAHSESLPEQSRYSFAHNTQYDTCTKSSPLTRPPIDILYADQLANNIWSKPREDSPSMFKSRESEWFDNPKLRHTLELNSPYVPYGGYVHPKEQTKWEDLPAAQPEISKQKRREKFPVVLSSMTKYVEEMNLMEFGFKLY